MTLGDPVSQPHVLVVGGPAGTGKSTIAELLSKHFQCPFTEGDLLHSAENVAKMSRGEPLTDDDRWGWLKNLSEVSTAKAFDPSNTSNVSIVSCSMLKKVYRDYIKQVANESQHNGKIVFRFIFLYTSFEELLQRVGQRQNHYMKSDMVKSQYDIMEIPLGDELLSAGGEALSVDTSAKSPDSIYKEIIDNLTM